MKKGGLDGSSFLIFADVVCSENNAAYMYTTAISNLAWSQSEAQQALSIVSRHSIFGLEIVPGLTWEHTCDVFDDEKKLWKENLAKMQILPVAMQAFLYNHPEYTLFGSEKTREELFNYTVRCLSVAKDLDIPAVIFGAPQNKKRGVLKRQVVDTIAIDFFRSLGDEAHKRDILFCIEPTPNIYGADYLTTTDEVVQLLQVIGHPNIVLNLDFGALKHEGKFTAEWVRQYHPYAGHIHISEPGLKPIDLHDEAHQSIADSLKHSRFSGSISVEMRLPENERFSVLTSTLDWLLKTYATS